MAAQAKNPYAAEGGVRPLKVMEIPSRPSRSSVGRFLKAGGGLGEVNQHEATVSEKVSRQTTDIYEIATHLPDQVVICDKETRIPFVNSSVGVLMFADISGFTALCEKYSLNAKIGTDQLTKCLNGYLGAIVEHIMSSDGDVLKYAGDAILALWRLDSSGKKGVRDRYLLLQSALIQALRCAAAIQHRCGTWLTDVGVTLRVKLGISAGEVTVAYLGNDEFRHYVTFGKAVQEVNLAEKFCQSGDIVLSPSAWKYCHQFNIPHKLASDGAHIHLVDSLDHLTHNLGYFAKYTSQRTASFDDVENCSITYSANIEKPRIRKAVTEHVKSSQDQMLKLYVAKPVLRKLEDHQPLEYLSEMRQVTIVFINLTLEKVNHAKLCELLQDVFCVIYQQAKSVFGCLNKVFMFDKGCTFLVIFGLPGFKHENDCAHALQCALKTLQTLNEMDSVTEASIGVTTGPTFCGVVGHQLRHEYTVIGRKVNMAARLMMHYPGKVTCDNETFHHSKLPKTSFIKLGFKEMKGLQNVGVIREYTEAEGQQQPVRVSTEKAEEDNALLGRAEEMQQVLDEVKLMQRNVKKGGQRSIIVLAGDAGVGKTRMIQGVIQEVQKQGIKVIHTQFLIHDAKYPFGLVKNMLLQLLGLNLEHTHQEREHILLNEFDDTTLINSLWLLNDLLALKLPQPEVHVDMDTETRRAALYSLLHRIVHEMTVKLGFLLFAVDDAHFMDTASWEFLVDLGQDARSLVVMTMRTSSRVSCPSADLVLSSKQTLHIRLGGLHADYLGPLACQLLDVISVPEELLSILEERSRGVPSWCEQLLREMYLAGDIIIVPADSENEDLDNLDVKSNPSNAMQDDEDGPRGKNLICLIAPGKSIGTIVPDSVKGMIQANIDRMEETDQMILKCASVIGITFTRSMLQALLPFKREINVRLCLKRLIETGVFECASAPQTTGPAGFVCTIKKKKENLQEENMVLKVKCHCAGVPENQRASLLDCRYLRFHSASIQETVYGMFMEKTRVQLHCTAAKYLETKAHKCRACGGGDFIHEYGGSFQGRRPSKRKENLQTCPQETKQEKQTTNASSPPPPNSANSKGEKLLVAGENASSKRKARRGKKMTIFKRSVDRSFRSDRRVSVSANAGTDVEMTRGKGKNAIAPSFEERPMSGLGERRMTSITICSEKGEMDRVRQQKGTKLYKLLGFGDKSNTTVSEEDDTSLAAVDLRECECIQILASVYPQLVHHWRAAGNVERTVHFLIEAAAAAVGISDNIQALAYLEEVQEILKSVRNGVNPFEGELSHHVGDLTIDPLEEARVETLTGQAQYQLGQSKESVTHFLNALQILGAPQPIRVLAKYIFIGRQAFLQYRHVKYPTRYLGTASTDQIAILISQAQCLSFLFHDYISSHDDTSAGMTVLQQLNKAEEADDDLHELIIAYTSMMEYCQQKNWHGWVRMYEKTAETRCMEVLHTINADDMVTLAHLYSVGLNMRLNSGLLEEAVESGYVADRITEKLHDNDMKIHMLPLLAQALLLSNKIHKCVEVLEQLEYCDDETDDMIGQAWYYGCCMDLILESGFQYVTQKACLEFAELALRDHTFNIDHLPLYYLSAALALWFTRKGDWEKARLWTKDANKNSPKQLKTFMAAHGFCKLVECKLIAYAYSIEKKQQKQMVTLQYDAQKDIKLLKKACQHLAVFKPHVLHLEAYMLRIQNKISASKKQLTKCIQLCDVNGNILEKHWAQHSLKVWFDKNCDRFQASFWLESSQQEVLDWHMANDLSEVEDSIVKYSLPLSHWFDSKGMIS